MIVRLTERISPHPGICKMPRPDIDAQIARERHRIYWDQHRTKPRPPRRLTMGRLYRAMERRRGLDDNLSPLDVFDLACRLARADGWAVFETPRAEVSRAVIGATCAYLRRARRWSYPRIARAVGLASHATVIGYCRRLESAVA